MRIKSIIHKQLENNIDHSDSVSTETDLEHDCMNYDSDIQVVLNVPNHNISWRTLVLSSRGISARQRHLMSDIIGLLPSTKKDNKFDAKHDLYYLNELCELGDCSHTIYFESRKRDDLYMWFSKSPQGPTIKFLVLNIHTLGELHFTGNCIKGSRAILSFDSAFDSSSEYRIIKEMLTQTFGTPYNHKKSNSYYDHVFQFSILDNKIWFRNYQVVDSIGKDGEFGLVEIGPRFVLSLVKILSGSFEGTCIATNSHYIPPNAMRKAYKQRHAHKYTQRQTASDNRKERFMNATTNIINPKDIDQDVFDN